MEMRKFIKIDTHVHTSGVSRCAQHTFQQAIDQKIKEGYDGLIMTNHCQSWYYAPTEEEHKQFVQKVIDEYHSAVAYAKDKGFRVMLGLEVTITNPFYSDWLLFGVTEAFLKTSPILYQLSQRELFALCEKENIFLVHAHPLRPTPFGEQYSVGERDFLRGVEINCSNGDLDKKDEIIEIAQEMGVVVTCGSDYHGRASYTPGAMIVPSWVETSVDFARYLKETDETWLIMGDKELKVPNFSKKV